MRISFIGGAGSGKSTTAHYIFGRLKMDGVKVEFVSEEIKRWTFIERSPIVGSFDEVALFGRQIEQEHEILEAAKIPHIVTECPLIVMAFYARYLGCPVADELISITNKIESRYPSIFVIMGRPDEYDRKARYETKEEAMAIDDKMTEFLFAQNYPKITFLTCDVKKGDTQIESLYDGIKSLLGGRING